MSSRVSTWLASGHAPSSWQREMAHSTAWLNALRSTCNWMGELIDLQPMLNNEPLLGRSLALLTTDIARQAQNPPEAVRQTRAKPARVQGSAKHERPFASNNETRPRKSRTDFTAHRLTSVSEITHFPGEIVHDYKKRRWARLVQSLDRAKPGWLAQVDKQVDYSLLYHWAGDSLVSETPVERPHRLPFVQDKAQQRYMIAQEQTFSSQPWQNMLVAQTRHVLYHAYQPAAMRTEYQPTTMYTEQEELLLPRQWATTIGGPAVPLELLFRYAALPRQDSTVANSNARDKDSTLPSHTQESRVPAQLSTAASENDQAGNMQPGNNHALAQLLEGGNHNNPQAEHGHAEHIHRAGDEHVHIAGNYGEQIMPPVVASQLPPLATSQRIDMPPLPVATATARLGARAEMIIEEDLDMLAAKIKRILDDEARRHGIDV